MCSPVTSLFPPRDICWLLSVHSPTGKQSPGGKTSSLCYTQFFFKLVVWDQGKGLCGKGWLWSGRAEICCKQISQSVQPGNGSVPLSYYQISGKECEIERFLSALFIGLFPPFSFLVESKEEMKDGLSEVITGIKQYFKVFQTCFHGVLL